MSRRSLRLLEFLVAEGQIGHNLLWMVDNTGSISSFAVNKKTPVKDSITRKHSTTRELTDSTLIADDSLQRRIRSALKKGRSTHSPALLGF